MWYYETPIGVLKIVKTSYGYGFLFGDDPTDWTGHRDPRALADDVYCHATQRLPPVFEDIERLSVFTPTIRPLSPSPYGYF